MICLFSYLKMFIGIILSGLDNTSILHWSLCTTRAVSDMQRAAETGDSDGWLQADFRLHEILFEMAGNNRSKRIIANLNDQWHRVRVGFVAMQGRIHPSTEEHIEFVESVLAGDGELAEQQMRTHLNNVRKEVTRLLEVMVLPFSQSGV